jgi:hypothetical protein
MRKTFLLLVLLCVLTNCNNGSNLIGNTLEPDYKYPWVVHDAGSDTCGGVLIEPRWILTAAHCHSTFRPVITITYSRTDPYSGITYMDSRLSFDSSEGLGQHGVHIHPMWTPGNSAHDIALVKLQSAFSISPYIQTVGLPTSPRPRGLTGTVAGGSQKKVLPQGSVLVFQGSYGDQVDGPVFDISMPSSSGVWLCPGDSGSGFVTFEDGRATVRGIVSLGTVQDCDTPPTSPGEVAFADVFTDLDFIAQTITDGASAGPIFGNTRVRWTGSAIRGVMGIGCPNPYDTMWGPLYVVGVAESANCEGGQSQAVVCWLPGLSRTNPLDWVFPLAITGFTMKSTFADGTTSVQSLPFSKTGADFQGMFLEGVIREFTCQIARSFNAPPEDGLTAR